MNHSTPGVLARTTRSTPSPPMPALRSHSARTLRELVVGQVTVDGAVGVGQEDEVVLGAVALEELVGHQP